MKGHIQKRGKDSWQVSVYLGQKDENGKYQRVTRTVHGKKKDAEAALAELQVQVNNGQVCTTKDTLGEYLLRWLDDYVKANLDVLTAKSYEMVIRKHIIPAIGKIPLKRLQPAQVQGYYTEMRKSGRTDGKGGLSNRTVLYHHRILHEALKHAMRLELIHRNVADAVIPPKMEEYEAITLTLEETARLLEAAKETRLYIPILLAISTGMRRGEVLGLRWKDVDLSRRTVRVVQILITDGKKLLFTPPKTKKSKRTIDITDVLTQALKKHKAEQAKEKLALGAVYRDNGLVITEPDGTPVNPDTFSARFRKLLKANDLPAVRFHGLRHTNATLLLENGANAKTVSSQLGHANIGVTMDTYGHVTKAMREKTVAIMEEILRKAQA